MAQITLKTPKGADAGSIELDDTVFGVQPNVPLMHQVVTAQLARRRAGTQSTKTRSEVRGGGAKPYRQKGTGNARQGSTNSPHYTGGGIAFGPKPRDYGQKTPKKMIKAALRSALSDRAGDGKVVVIDSWGFDGPKTKDAKAALAALGLDGGKALVVIESFDTPVARSFRNLQGVQLIKAGELNAYDVLCNDWIVFERHLLPQGAEPTRSTAPAGATVEPEIEIVAVHGEDPAEGPRDEAVTGEAADDTQAVTASAPDRSVDATTGELQRASGEAAIEDGDQQ
jgi:large subunit ribosomal protein L4